jgi:hypothetical protein
MKSIIAILFFCLVAYVSAQSGRHSAAEIFNGAFFFVNGTAIVNGTATATKDPTLGPLLGNLVYAPAYPGALFGNMSVVFGNDLPSNSTCAQVISLVSAYTGPYTVYPDANPPYVVHFPIITNNPINGHTPKDVPAIRYYNTYEDDNLLSVTSLLPTPSSLYWSRNFPFPPAPTCTLAASVTASGSGWDSGDVSYQQYTLDVTNVGESSITTATITINLAPTQSISASWNIQLISGNTYSVALYSGLAVGASQSSAGFIVAGAGSVTVAVPPDGTVCN